ncbi:MAG: hypothetical protein CMI02_07610 [Oceanospirillaceae bacterium]|nr:hypothetical protein [Oceanospirillaceae bacterium]MBT11884.1 hypothetical protein [Oceanospirillaceae bacterium]|tara:strand:+ start:77 stop:871 length:795 start_codon:yes stop_codon:yes gene_type:complete
MSFILKITPILIALLSLNVTAASYDCSLETLNKVEKIICDSESLSDKDELLHDLYALIPKGLESHQYQILFPALKKSQKTWLDNRNLCDSLGCLSLSYDSRITYLRNRLIWQKEKTSKKYILELVEAEYNDFITERQVEDVIFYSVIEGEYAEYLVRLSQSMALNGNYCGSGRVISYVYLKYSFKNNQVENKRRLISHDCGNDYNLLTHKIEMNSDGELSIVTFFDYMSGGAPKEAFRITVGDVFSGRKNFITEKESYPKEPWG